MSIFLIDGYEIQFVTVLILLSHYDLNRLSHSVLNLGGLL